MDSLGGSGLTMVPRLPRSETAMRESAGLARSGQRLVGIGAFPKTLSKSRTIVIVLSQVATD